MYGNIGYTLHRSCKLSCQHAIIKLIKQYSCRKDITMASITDEKYWSEFFRLYKDMPILWQRSRHDYKNKRKRRYAWEKLLRKYQEIDKDANLATLKFRIKSIRACFSREFKKTERDSHYTPQLWYFERLLFLKNQDAVEGRSFDHSVFIKNNCDAYNDMLVDQVEETIDMFHESVSNKRLKLEYLPKAESTHSTENYDYFNAESNDSTDNTDSNQLDTSTKVQITYTKEKDDASIYADNWGILYQKLSAKQKIFAKKAIEDVLVLGQLQQLTFDTVELVSGYQRSDHHDSNNRFSLSPSSSENGDY